MSLEPRSLHVNPKDPSSPLPISSSSPEPKHVMSRMIGGWWALTLTFWLIEGGRYLVGGQDGWTHGLWVIWGLMGSLSLALISVVAVLWWITRRSWPALKTMRTGHFIYLALWLIIGACGVIFATQWGVSWSSARFRQPLYRELFAGLTAASAATLSVLLLPALYRGGLDLWTRLSSRFTVNPHLRSYSQDPSSPPLTSSSKSSLKSSPKSSPKSSSSLRRMIALITSVLWLGVTILLCWKSPKIVGDFVSALENVDLRTPRALLIGIWVTFIFIPWWRESSWSDSKRVSPSSSWMKMSWLLSMVLMGSGLYQGVHLTPESAARLNRDSALATWLIGGAQRLTDDDRDGASDRWGGGDCDDRDVKRFPDAVEPNKKRDLNCNHYTSDPRDWTWPNAKAKADIRSRERAYYGPPERALQQARAPRHLIVLTIDALRYDAYLNHMPKTRAFAQKSVDFSAAYSAGAATYWSVPALLGSRPPSFFKMGRDQTPVKRERLLTESLKDQGFHTGLFANVTIFFVRGLSQGAITKNYKTSRYTVHGAKPGSRHLTDGIIKHIDAWRAKKLRPQRRRLFVWGHYYDPHDPYFDVPNYPARSAQAHHRYEAIVRSVDAELGRLFQALETRGMLKDTAVVLTADHGDEFGEHGHRFHGRTLYDEMVRVPLIVYSPAYPPQKVKEVISHLDVAPTLLSHLGLKPEPRFLGQDWDSALRRGRSVAQSEAFFEVLPDANYGLHLIGMRHGDEKLIYHVQSGALERFKLKTDPHELMNLTVRSAQKINQSSQNTRRLMGYVEAHLRQLARRESGARFPR